MESIINMRKKDINRSLEKFRIDCGKCSGLCCTALFFSKIDGFPENKVSGKPCTKLDKDYKCKIHDKLEKLNMKGCIGYDCFGAGQYVTQHIYSGETWQNSSKKSNEIFEVFTAVFQLYQIRYFLEYATIIISDKVLIKNLESLINENENICRLDPKAILDFDINEYRNRANVYLKSISSSIVDSFGNNKNNKIMDFIGKDFKKKNMSGYDLSMKLLIAANFDSCIFEKTIFLGSDTRDTDFNNADLSEAIFLTQGQVNLAKGNLKTKLPMHLDYPTTWKIKHT